MSTEIQKSNGNGNAAEKRGGGDPQNMLKAYLEKMKPAMAAVLPKHVTPDRITKVVLSATSRQPGLLECTIESIARSVMQASELGLEIGGLLGEAYLVPYKNNKNGKWIKEAQCITGYRGLLKLARNSGLLVSLCANIVYANDEFEADLATATVSHRVRASMFTGDRGELVGVYAFAVLKDGGKQLEVMSKGQVDLVRARSKASGSGPWVTDYEQMTRKTVIRRISNYLPLSPELQRALEHDDAIETEGHAVESGPSLLPEKGARTKALTEAVMNRASSIASELDYEKDLVTAPPDAEPASEPAMREPGSDDE